ncbi:MAG: hypothetical protein OXN24_02185 [Candidatus Dadabacteria bacterium]|nr:hypothetical protein [Candidatus Dadabacteria bacterium]
MVFSIRVAKIMDMSYLATRLVRVGVRLLVSGLFGVDNSSDEDSHEDEGEAADDESYSVEEGTILVAPLPEGDIEDTDSDYEEGSDQQDLSFGVPEIVSDFPAMTPWKGSNYESDAHRKLMVLLESPYLPKGESIGSRQWYRLGEEELLESGKLSELGHAHISLQDNVKIGEEGNGRWRVDSKSSHRPYERINEAVGDILHQDVFVLDHVVLDNYFQRAADNEDGVRGLKVKGIDILKAEEKLRWNLAEHDPDVVLVASRKIPDEAIKLMTDQGREVIVTDHPSYRRVPWLRNRTEVMDALKDAWIKPKGFWSRLFG